MTTKRQSLVTTFAPGILVAATGVGAGDLLTAGLAGSSIGITIIWAALLGAILKWFLNEGIARWQMATNTTLLEGWITHLGRWIRWVFLTYLLIWTIFTGGALVNACGLAGQSFCRLGVNESYAKIGFGVIHALVGYTLVRWGGFRIFERVMSVCVAIMFVTVIVTAVLLTPDWAAVGASLIRPTLPGVQDMPWLLGVLGGVGGTLTLLSYGYWIREEKRSGTEGLKLCRVDLALGYAMTAAFGMAMIIIGSRTTITRAPGGIAQVAINLADQLAMSIGPAGKWIFLAGFWGAVFSSLLGVWQSVPYLFADFYFLRKEGPTGASSRDLTTTRPYRGYLAFMTLASLPLLVLSVRQAQLAYAILGSFFIPLLALTLLILNNRRGMVGDRHRNGIFTNLVLISTLAFFAYLTIDTTIKS
ncbi:MAG: Nramp family divalent metal transporter [Planctomycetota bacterium]|jgi:Mn2+/Fe2+ NRAMP family transporter